MPEQLLSPRRDRGSRRVDGVVKHNGLDSPWNRPTVTGAAGVALSLPTGAQTHRLILNDNDFVPLPVADAIREQDLTTTSQERRNEVMKH